MGKYRSLDGLLWRCCLLVFFAALAGILIGCGTTATPTADPPTTTPTIRPTVLSTVTVATPSAPASVPPGTPPPATGTAAIPSVPVAGPTGTPTPDATRINLEVKAGYPEGSFLDSTTVVVVTAASMHYDANQTAIALTPTATEGPTDTPAPTRTPGVGLIRDQHCIPPITGGYPGFPSCWAAGVPGAWVLVGGGTRGSPGDPDHPVQSIILVCPEPCGFPPTATLSTRPHAMSVK